MLLRPHRRRVAAPTARATKVEVREGTPLAQRPLGLWTQRILELQRSDRWKELDAELTAIASHPAYHAQHLDYLHARTKQELGENEEAKRRFSAFLAGGNAYRDLALIHLAEIADSDDEQEMATQLRRQFIRDYPQSNERDEAIDEVLRWLDEKGTLGDLQTFTSEVYVSASSQLRRELDARLASKTLRSGGDGDAIARATRLLRGGLTDDPADRVLLALDHDSVRAHLTPDVLLLMGHAAKEHRHFERAVGLLQAAKRHAPPAQQDGIQFDIGRSHFGNEQYDAAKVDYLAGAAATHDPKMKATFLFHASRAAQLGGDDSGAEKLMTQALAVPGRFPATSAALTQRMRTRLKQGRWGEATADLSQLKKLFPADHAFVEASLAFALAQLARGETLQADVTLNSIPPKLLAKYEGSEISYWRGRANEGRALDQAAAHYLNVLRSNDPTHFAYFARERLAASPMKERVAQIVAARSHDAESAIQSRQFEVARRAQTDVVLLAPTAANLAKLSQVYRQIPSYRAILELKPAHFPELGDPSSNDRGDQLLRLGLFDEAADGIARRFPLRPLSSGVAQSLAMNQAGASKESILAIEIVMKSVPNDFIPELLPHVMLELLYPRYFYDSIEADATRFHADPRLVVSIMREESRFNPRAKSIAAARGLLQFIITTARDVGQSIGLVKLEPDDLYDPRTIIQLGAKYIGDLQNEFGGDAYASAAAYNAGPHQVQLWRRLAPAAGDDYFLSSINFDETKQYVRKVLNSYWRYSEIYEGARPAVGYRAEP